MTTQCAAFIDRGAEDYMLETAMLKVFSTEALWTIVNDTLQIYGGQGYFTRDPYERMMRDARINMIGEGANDVLKAFIAVVGMRGVGEHLKDVLEALKHPLKGFGTLWSFGRDRLAARFSSPEVPVLNAQLRKEADALSARVSEFGVAVVDVLELHAGPTRPPDESGQRPSRRRERSPRGTLFHGIGEPAHQAEPGGALGP